MGSKKTNDSSFHNVVVMGKNAIAKMVFARRSGCVRITDGQSVLFGPALQDISQPQAKVMGVSTTLRAARNVLQENSTMVSSKSSTHTDQSVSMSMLVQQAAHRVRWGIFARAAPVTSRIARPPPAAFAHRDRRQPQAHCVRRGITARAAPMTSRIARPTPAAFAQRDRRQPQAHCVRWGITAWAVPAIKKSARQTRPQWLGAHLWRPVRVTAAPQGLMAGPAHRAWLASTKL